MAAHPYIMRLVRPGDTDDGGVTFPGLVDTRSWPFIPGDWLTKKTQRRMRRQQLVRFVEAGDLEPWDGAADESDWRTHFGVLAEAFEG